MLELTMDTRVDLSRSGARFGAALFETIRIQDGRPRWLELHLERLAAGCAFLGLDGPPPADDLESRIPMEGNGVLRLLAVDDALLAWTGPRDPAPVLPIRIGLSRDTIRHPGPLTRHKTTNYLENLQLMTEARSRNLEDVVAPTPVGHLSDGGRSTLVLVAGDHLLTPPVDDGALPGIGRRVLLEAGLLREASLTPADLAQAPAAALVSALRGLRAVAEFEGAALDPSHPALGEAWALLR